MSIYPCRRFVASATSAAILVLQITTAFAEPDSAELVLKKIAALEARVVALETTNRKVRRDADDARAQAQEANEGLARISGTQAGYVSPRSSALNSNARLPDRPALNGWAGVYWGASAGGAATRSNVLSAGRDTQNSPSSSFPFNVSAIDIMGSSTSKNGYGGVVDLFGGWNVQLARVVLGAQLEATAADLNFSSTGVRNYTYLNAAGPTGMTAVSDFRPQVASRWMASALLRAGLLLDEQTLIYGIGGWTGAQFEARNVTDNAFYQPVETFWSNGWTAGGGLERKLDSAWSVRAEYRYTEFGNLQTNDHFYFSSSFPNTQSSDRQNNYRQSMQSGRVGVVYSFGSLD
jgi:opacity protein-like surface antigen